VLADVADEFGVRVPAGDALVLADYDEGVRRGVIGSPHYFTAGGDFFCPALDVGRDAGGHLHVAPNPERFERFVQSCFEWSQAS